MSRIDGLVVANTPFIPACNLDDFRYQEPDGVILVAPGFRNSQHYISGASLRLEVCDRQGYRRSVALACHRDCPFGVCKGKTYAAGRVIGCWRCHFLDGDISCFWTGGLYQIYRGLFPYRHSDLASDSKKSTSQNRCPYDFGHGLCLFCRHGLQIINCAVVNFCDDKREYIYGRNESLAGADF